mgnify:CR=1 FL=1
MGMIANGVETIRRTSEDRDLQRIGELIAEYEVDTMVVGYPKNMNGSVGERAQSCEDFARVIGERFPQLKIVLWDERLSTVAAEKVLIDADLRRSKRKKVIDMMAAVVILQNYLDIHKVKGRNESMAKKNILSAFVALVLVAFVLLFQFGGRAAEELTKKLLAEQTALQGTLKAEEIQANWSGDVIFKNVVWVGPDGKTIAEIPLATVSVNLFDALLKGGTGSLLLVMMVIR